MHGFFLAYALTVILDGAARLGIASGAQAWSLADAWPGIIPLLTMAVFHKRIPVLYHVASLGCISLFFLLGYPTALMASVCALFFSRKNTHAEYFFSWASSGTASIALLSEAGFFTWIDPSIPSSLPFGNINLSLTCATALGMMGFFLKKDTTSLSIFILVAYIGMSGLFFMKPVSQIGIMLVIACLFACIGRWSVLAISIPSFLFLFMLLIPGWTEQCESFLFHYMSPTTAHSANVRLWLWTTGMESWMSHPYCGIGRDHLAGSYDTAHAMGACLRIWGSLDHPHNVFIKLLLSGGLLGVIFIVTIIMIACRNTRNGLLFCSIFVPLFMDMGDGILPYCAMMIVFSGTYHQERGKTVHTHALYAYIACVFFLCCISLRDPFHRSIQTLSGEVFANKIEHQVYEHGITGRAWMAHKSMTLWKLGDQDGALRAFEHQMRIYPCAPFLYRYGSFLLTHTQNDIADKVQHAMHNGIEKTRLEFCAMPHWYQDDPRSQDLRHVIALDDMKMMPP